ncbi:hypothetical protein MRX96_006838 [Rhipicephalus microplus]
MPKKQAEVDENPSKAGRQAKRQTADAADNGPTSEAPAAKRPRGRPRKAVATEPLAPKPPRELSDAVREKPREKEEAPREPPPRPVCLIILGHNKHALESAREASPRAQPRLLGPRRKARQGKEEGFEQRIDNEAARKEAEEKVGG